ncbi:FAD-binding domain-containing protein [Sciscionella sediminilitoris]|uniref:FAD-binding domain-containing protein n=1 Tax=Sciscionella sediminilitoris TaxID=1445613 RepID=UPI001E48E0EC|nr:FAD-binding domain-containing protein [Sciscionella sp. SE31]
MLNPLRQAERYDPPGDYTRRGVPELAGLDQSRRPPAVAPRRIGAARARPATTDLDTARRRFHEQRRLALDI